MFQAGGRERFASVTYETLSVTFGDSSPKGRAK